MGAILAEFALVDEGKYESRELFSLETPPFDFSSKRMRRRKALPIPAIRYLSAVQSRDKRGKDNEDKDNEDKDNEDKDMDGDHQHGQTRRP